MTDQSFADIFRQWEQTHDETSEMKKRARRTQGVSNGPSSNGATLSELRRMKAQNELDLHDYKLDEAIKATEVFLEDCSKRGLKKIRIITGKGLHSKGGEAVLRPRIIQLCSSSKLVREVSSSKLEDGGSGALSVILR